VANWDAQRTKSGNGIAAHTIAGLRAPDGALQSGLRAARTFPPRWRRI
jgi:hypothetical protein